MPDQIIVNVRTALSYVRKALAPETRRVFDNARANTPHGIEVLKHLEDFLDVGVKVSPEVYLLLAVEQLTDLVEELAAESPHRA
jgi:hypothetical protein